jgi:aryl-alcohol dehydrogenase-like predicted oxidoreductase
VREPGRIAIGTWSGGRYLRFGEAIDEDRLVALLRPGDGIDTVLTADAYGQGEADRVLGRALEGVQRETYSLVGAVGHDFYEGERAGPKGFPRFTDPALRGPDRYADYLRMATEASLERLGASSFDLLLLHNPDRTGYGSEAVWDGMAALREAGVTARIGVAPGPANGFTLDLISCVERFGGLIDWAMLILNPFEPWPGSLALPACEGAGVRVIARVVDYGGVFHDDLPDEGSLAPGDHRSFRPAGWVAAARAKLDAIRPIAERHALTPLQLACQWTLAQPAVASVVPTLIQEPGPAAKPIEQEREELAGLPAGRLLDDEELARIGAVGDNAGCMRLKGGSPAHTGEPLPDAWPLADDLVAAAGRWGIVPERDLMVTA